MVATASARTKTDIDLYNEFVKSYEWYVSVVEGKPIPESLVCAQGQNVYDMANKFGGYYGETIQTALEAHFMHQSFFDLGSYAPNYELARECPPSWAPDFKFIVLDHIDTLFVIGTDRPADPQLRIALMTQLRSAGYKNDREAQLVMVMVAPAVLKQHLQKVRIAGDTSIEKMAEAALRAHTTGAVRQVEAAMTEAQYLERFERARKGDADKAALYMLDLILIKAYSVDDPSKRASDVHIEPGHEGGNFRVRFRINGRCVDQGGWTMLGYTQFATAMKGACDRMDMSQRGKLQTGRHQVRLLTSTGKELKLDIRAECMPSGSAVGGDAPEKFIFRILDSSAERPTLRQLVCNDAKLEGLIRQVLDLPKGLILLTGPTGSGKTTTLSRFIVELGNDPGWTIYTLEDPIEYEYSNENIRVTQVQIDPDRQITFPTGLRSFLRSDPDIIMVGEMRDEVTMELALRAGLTGHQVLSTLHTNDVASAILRLIDMGAKPYILSEILTCVIAQTLVPSLCPECKQPTKLTEAVRRDLPSQYHDFEFFRAVGCSKCGSLGYLGRMPILDVMYVDDRIKQMIAQSDAIEDIRRYNELTYSPGLFCRALEAAKQGYIDLPTAFTVRDEILLEEKEKTVVA
jgi:type II secretory ATPase GspE/PulE/Tfp pilus assembly ATPase PilB-like protein